MKNTDVLKSEYVSYFFVELLPFSRAVVTGGDVEREGRHCACKVTTSSSEGCDPDESGVNAEDRAIRWHD